MLEKILNGLDKIRSIPTGFLLALSIVLGLILFLPDQVAKILAVKDFRNSYRTFLGPSFLIGIAFALTKMIMGIESL